MGNTVLAIGPTGSAPQAILQSDHQAKYDGSKTLGSHIIRYGFDFNRIAAAGFVPVQSLAPFLSTNVGLSEETFAQTGPFPGGDTNPLNYPVEYVTVSNGLGYVTPTPGLGLPAGSFFYQRLAAYVGVNSKFKRNLTLTYGLRYAREPGRSDSKFSPIPQLNALIPGLGNRVRQPNSNFAPQLGFAWDPTGKGKMSVRGGIGLFYENVLTIVAPLDPLYRAPVGDVFLQSPIACNGTATPQPVPISGGALEHGRNLVMLEAFDVVEDEDHAIAGGKRCDGSLERDAVYRTGERLIAGAEVALGSVVLGGVDGLFERDQLQALLAQMHEHQVDGEAVQPGGEGGLAAEAAELAEEVEEGLLGHVLGLGYVAEHAQTEGVDATLVQRVELCESVRVAVLGALDGICFAGDWSVPLEEAGVRFRLHSG